MGEGKTVILGERPHVPGTRVPFALVTLSHFVPTRTLGSGNGHGGPFYR